MSLRQGITKGAQIEITYYCEFNFVHLHKILPKPSPITNVEASLIAVLVKIITFVANQQMTKSFASSQTSNCNPHQSKPMNGIGIERV